MSTASERLAAIEAAIAEGVTEVTFRGRTVKYRTLNEMRSIRDELKKQTGTSSGPDVLKVEYCKGY